MIVYTCTCYIVLRARPTATDTFPDPEFRVPRTPLASHGCASTQEPTDRWRRRGCLHVPLRLPVPSPSNVSPVPELSTVPPCIVNSSCMRRLPAYGRVRLRALGMIGSLPQQSSGELNKPHTPCAALGGCDFAGACDGASVCSLVGFCSVKRTLLAILLAARSSFSQVARHCAEG